MYAWEFAKKRDSRRWLEFRAYIPFYTRQTKRDLRIPGGREK